MMSEWKEYKLGDVLLKITKGTTPPRGKGFVDNGINYIKSDAIGYDGRIDDSLFVSIDEETHEKFKRSQLEKGDILFSMAGVFLGKNAIVKEEHLPANTNQALAIIRLNQELAKPKFVNYYLRQPAIIEYVNNMSGQSAQPNINFQEISSIEIPLPKITEQENVIEVLSSLDDKIDLLHRQNQTLEQMAEALFRQWFVERRPELAEGEADEAILVTDIIDFNPSLKLGKGALAPYLEMKNLEERSSVPNGWRYREFTSGMRFQNGDTLFARISPCLENGKSCYVQFMQEDEVGWGSTEFIVMRSKNGFSRFLSYVLANSSDFKDFAANTLAGSSGRQRAQLDIVKEYELVMPNPERLGVLNGAFDAMSKRIGANEKTIRTLTHLRDTLLPKLMSGKVKVKND